jgi:hypothetical protein
MFAINSEFDDDRTTQVALPVAAVMDRHLDATLSRCTAVAHHGAFSKANPEPGFGHPLAAKALLAQRVVRRGERYILAPRLQPAIAVRLAPSEPAAPRLMRFVAPKHFRAGCSWVESRSPILVAVRPRLTSHR